MPNTLGRNLINLCFTKIKLPVCYHPTQPSPTPDDQSRPFPSNSDDDPTTSESTLIKNFNSLYESKSLTQSPSSLSTSSSSATTSGDIAAADFATVFASNRFFFSTPGRSNSIIDSTTSSSSSASAATAAEPDRNLFNNSVAVPTFSPNPFADFRRSMQEMLEAREVTDVNKSNWEFLHELLLCYLALNPKSTHKFIIAAFSDLVVSLMPTPPGSEGGEFAGGDGSEISGR
ncbi:hypothetical protein UlMin_031446 [Ulmus minor]